MQKVLNYAFSLSTGTLLAFLYVYLSLHGVGFADPLQSQLTHTVAFGMRCVKIAAALDGARPPGPISTKRSSY